MTDPARWSRTPGLPEDLARALETARAMEPPPGMQQQVFAGVLGAVGAAATGSAAASAGSARAAADAGSSAVAGGATTAKLATWVLLGVGALGVGALGAAVALRPAQHFAKPAAQVGTPAAAPATRSTTVSLQRDAPPRPEPNAARSSAPTPAERGVRQPRSTLLRSTLSPSNAPEYAPVSESQRVIEARACLRAGDLACALTSLDAADRAATPGVLAQERALLRIRALHRLGRRTEATQLAGTFLDLYPDSPYAAEARAYSKPAENQRE